MFILYANKNQLTARKKEPVTSGSVNVYTARFEFSSDWDGLDKTVIFRAGTESRAVRLDSTGTASIPWEALQNPGLTLYCGVYGTKGGHSVLPTIWATLGVVLEGASLRELSYPPTPELWEQQLDTKGDGLVYDGLNLSLMSGDRPLSTVQIAGGDGASGVPGSPGPEGPQGEQGPPGKSAYEIAVENGFQGAEQEWLESLKGEPGRDGIDGTDGADGKGVAPGGVTGQMLVKASAEDFDTTWADPPTGGGGGRIPTGGIIIWFGAEVPDGWALCDGTNGTPDLRGRFVLGESEGHSAGETGGEEEVTLTVEQMPSHNHRYYDRYSGSSSAGTAGTIYAASRSTSYTTDSTGGSKPHPNMPPYYVLAYIMKL